MQKQKQENKENEESKFEQDEEGSVKDELYETSSSNMKPQKAVVIQNVDSVVEIPGAPASPQRQ